ncbi:hypothetical protein [Azospirillum sp. sgz301742]
MSDKTIIITAADTNFMDLARGLLLSLGEHAADLPVGLLDLGLIPEHREELAAARVNVVSPGWHASSAFLTAYNVAPWYRAMTARPYLRTYFPGYETYVWIDSDAWVCSANAIPTLVRAAQTREIAIVSSADRSYQRHHGHDLVRGRSLMVSLLKLMVPEKPAQMMSIGSEYCSGVFAMTSDSPIWEMWATSLDECMDYMLSNNSQPAHIFEQVALNMVLHSRPLSRLGLLPARFDWVVGEALPMVDAERGCLCEPQPPFEPIEIVHLIHLGRGTDKLGTVELQTTSGEVIPTSLGYGSVRELLDQVSQPAVHPVRDGAR